MKLTKCLEMFENMSIDKVEMQAYAKIKMVPKSRGVVAYGVLRRWFADVSGLGWRSKPGCSCIQPRSSGKRRWRST